MNSAVPPCLPDKPATSVTVPAHCLPLTQALRQQILRGIPFPSALGGPFAAPLFAPLSAMQNSLWMRCAVLLPPQWFTYLVVI